MIVNGVIIRDVESLREKFDVTLPTLKARIFLFTYIILFILQPITTTKNIIIVINVSNNVSKYNSTK